MMKKGWWSWCGNTLCGGDGCTSEVQDVNRIIQENLPAIENETSNLANTINTGTNVVYQAVENGMVKYVGITNNFLRRASEHLNSERNIFIQQIPGLNNLSRFDPRAVEQVLIKEIGLPNLLNKINSIATTNPIFQTAISRGYDIFRLIGSIPK